LLTESTMTAPDTGAVAPPAVNWNQRRTFYKVSEMRTVNGAADGENHFADGHDTFHIKFDFLQVLSEQRLKNGAEFPTCSLAYSATPSKKAFSHSGRRLQAVL